MARPDLRLLGAASLVDSAEAIVVRQSGEITRLRTIGKDGRVKVFCDDDNGPQRLEIQITNGVKVIVHKNYSPGAIEMCGLTYGVARYNLIEIVSDDQVVASLEVWVDPDSLSEHSPRYYVGDDKLHPIGVAGDSVGWALAAKLLNNGDGGGLGYVAPVVVEEIQRLISIATNS